MFPEDYQQFQCPDCQEQFDNEAMLLLHSRCHSPVTRMFQCSICKKRFTTEAMCQIHMAFHNPEKACVYCGEERKGLIGRSGACRATKCGHHRTDPATSSDTGTRASFGEIGDPPGDNNESVPRETTATPPVDARDRLSSSSADGVGRGGTRERWDRSRSGTPSTVDDTSTVAAADTPTSDAMDTAQPRDASDEAATQITDSGGRAIKTEQFTCTSCRIHYEVFALYLMHQACHSDLGELICSACGCNFETVVEFNLHIMNKEHFHNI